MNNYWPKTKGLLLGMYGMLVMGADKNRFTTNKTYANSDTFIRNYQSRGVRLYRRNI